MTRKSDKRSAWQLALKTYRENPGQCVGFILVQFALRLAVLLPLLFLLANRDGERWMRWLVWLWVPAFIFIVLPARQSAAFAMKRLLDGEGRLFAPDLLSCDGCYRTRLLNGLKTLPLTLPWFLPLAAGCFYAILNLNGTQAGKTDGLTLMVNITNLGRGDPVRGAVMVAAIFLLLLFIGLAGLGFQSGRRHENARDSKPALRGRGRTVLLWFSGLLLVVPFAAVLAFLLYRYAKSSDLATFATDMLSMLASGQLPLPGRHALAAVAALAALLLPVIPLKSLLTAARVAILHGDVDEAGQ